VTLSATEVERGWVEHECPKHGFLVATTPRAVVNCECGRVARILRHGRVVDEKTLKVTSAKARSLNGSGQPNLYACADCGADFGGKTISRRHRVGRGSGKRCLTASEMQAKGWRKSDRGRWVLPAPRGFKKDRPLTPGEAVIAPYSLVPAEGGIAVPSDRLEAL
jgi:hypothetical protein